MKKVHPPEPENLTALLVDYDGDEVVVYRDDDRATRYDEQHGLVFDDKEDESEYTGIPANELIRRWWMTGFGHPLCWFNIRSYANSIVPLVPETGAVIIGHFYEGAP